MALTAVLGAPAGAINYTQITDTSADFSAVSSSTYFYNKADKLVRFKNSSGTVLEIFSAAFPYTGSALITGSLGITGSVSITKNSTASGSSLTVYGSGSTLPVLTVQGSQGELFSITDSLSGSLFSVNDISGLPILEVFSDNTTLLGSYLAPSLNTTTKVTTVAGNNIIYSIPTSSYDGAWFEYTARSGSNARAGQIMSIWSGSTVNFTETPTTEFGSTSGLAFTMIVTGSNFALTGSSTTAGWVVKTIIRSI